MWLEPFALADRLVTCGEWFEFMASDGYRRPEYWLSDGWATQCRRRAGMPLYWDRRDDQWFVYTLNGEQPLTLRFRSSTSATARRTPTPAGPGIASRGGKVGDGGLRIS